MLFIHSLENLCSVPSRNLLRGAPSPTGMMKMSFEEVVGEL